MGGEVAPFTVSVGDDALDELRRRLARARWPEPAPAASWSQGVPLDWLRDLCGYWQSGYDWRRLEDRLNGLAQFTTELDGLDVHFMHLRSPHPDALPLIVTHGWPGSVVEFLDVVGPLADPVAHGGEARDAFHVVCPSLPGFGFSARPAEPGWGPARIARAWAALMSRLGYERFGAQGGDWGAIVTTTLAAQHPRRLAGIHLNMLPVVDRDDRLDTADLTDFERQSLAAAADHREWGSGYALEQATRPQTVGYGLVDSPVGQCAWIAEKYWAWTDHDGDPLGTLSRDQMLDNISVYWHTATAASSARIYWENGFARPSGRSARPPEPLAVPVGFSAFPREIFRPSRRWCQRYYPDLRFYEQPPRGGHFAAFEQPELFVDQVRRAFRTMR
ncbi:epoxide hydrolase family protein [Dactylosporangium sp. NPDC000555]|uniref:epoxide hydrolase family protein n=1 Tax=Dactylosporangium sp. NPDC000555 TaxID=3154260 RepID=UPI00332545A1